MARKKNPKLRVAVFMGGPSQEHEVSLWSGEKIMSALDAHKYSATPIVITKKGKWPITPTQLKNNFDVALIAAMHGEYGEDGGLQRALKKIKIPFTGSGPLASKKGMDKVVSDRLFKKARLRTPRFKEFVWENIQGKDIENPFAYPVVIKPSDRGSSVGVYIVANERELRSALLNASAYSSRIMIQEFIKGRELTCGVLEINGKTKALPVTEIRPKNADFFDFKSKYAAGGSEEITPAKISPAIARTTKRAALLAHTAIGARGYSRTDMILRDKRLYILEINTLPGMTATSLLPQEAAAIGIDFTELLDIIITAALG